MATLTLHNLGCAFGPRRLFDGLDLVVAPGETWGLLGANGSGKSTLLSVIGACPAAGLETTGRVTVSPPDATIGWLRQEVARDDVSVADFVRDRTGVSAAGKEMDDLAEQLATSDVGDAYADALEHWLALGGADFDERFAVVAAGLELDVSPDTAMSGLSGGQAARANLAALMLARHDIVLLDEPTNDLDAAGLEILEQFVAGDHRPMIVISHDREFLARTTTGIVELDSAQQTIAIFRGGYEAYLTERQRARDRARQAYEDYERRRAGLAARITTQKNWLDKGKRRASAPAKDNDKILRNASTARTEKQAAKIAQSERAIDRLEEVTEPRREWVLQLSIAEAARSGTVVSTLNNATVTAGDFSLGPISLQINAGDRVLIEGDNGAGKSTLLQALTDSANLGSSVVIGRVEQLRDRFATTVSLGDAFAGLLADWTTSEVRTLLAKFGLAEQKVTSPGKNLSPGERTRAALALLQAQGCNTLVLDEPTNHLDVPAIEQLEQAIDAFSGTVMLITHDRRLKDSFRATRILTVQGGEVSEVLA
ncbi:ABC-F family ATP-binding cassette domain-containing protein [Corynebacterium mendelii]|uniref:ABC-F family ATP-binding cassette domain-containing protein n=1 Tax=Corynebacterium mendelii TaxID=2765362 RepID=A0A939E0J7_9CORY|nr:ABC-F family ATP-binding cassette domain-containing protein [Corynebacterium mendelii]MBN9643516.1 ABC-F family ATP-binding cassette domain-containing protein [Corynebacterium mendelii]